MSVSWRFPNGMITGVIYTVLLVVRDQGILPLLGSSRGTDQRFSLTIAISSPEMF